MTPDISRSVKNTGSADTQNFGGPVYVQIGERVPIKVIGHDPSRAGFQAETLEDIEVVYPVSSVAEFYYYRQPKVFKVAPTSGLTDGGTDLEITGAWFDSKPEYGVHPFCKIGDNIIRGKFV